MRVGLVRNVGLSAVALLALGLAGCDDNPLEFEDGAAAMITTNPSTMIMESGETTLLESRTVDEGSRPTWDDITAAIDATCGAATLTVVVAADNEPQVIPPGRFDVTAGTTLGTTCITLTGAGLTASVGVSVAADSLEILVAPDTMNVFSTTQLSAAVFGSGVPVGPLDPADLAWTSSSTGVISVDAAGVATADGAGSATITATWTKFGVTVASANSVTIAVRVPVPVLLSADVANADAGDLITLTGTGFLVGPHAVFVDGVEVSSDALLGWTVIDATTATFVMPPGAAGATAVTVGSSIAPPLGGFSAAVAVTRDTDDFEPNQTFGAAPALPAFPVVIDNWFDGGAGDVDDFWMWSPAAGVTVDLGLSWVGSSGDLDLLFHTAQPPGSYNACFALATGNVPEAGQCTFAPGTYAVRVNAYDGATEFTRYTLTMTVVP